MSFGLSGAALAGIAVGGATLVSGLAQADAAKSASRTQAGAAVAGIEEQRRQFDALQALLKPYTEAGLPALEQQQALIGLRGPEEERAAIERISGGARFQELTRQGEEALLQRASATGGLRGGNIQGALAQFRPQVLNALIEEQYGRLGGMTQLGQRSAAGVGAAGMEAGGDIANLLGRQASALAGGDIAQGRALASIPSSIAGGLGIYQGLGGRFGSAPSSSGLMDDLTSYGVF